MRPLRASGELDLLRAGRRSISAPGSGTAATLRMISCGVLLVFSGRQATAAGHTDPQNLALAAESGAEFVSIGTFVVGSDRRARGLAAKFRLSGAGIDCVAPMLQNPLIVTEAGPRPRTFVGNARIKAQADARSDYGKRPFGRAYRVSCTVSNRVSRTVVPQPRVTRIGAWRPCHVDCSAAGE
jgi:hypothetical protein